MSVAKFFRKYFPFEKVVDSKGELVVRGLSYEAFAQINRENPELRLERDRNGDIIVLPPLLAATGIRIAKLTTMLGQWNDVTRLGKCCSSNVGYELSDGSYMTVHLSWISNGRLADVSTFVVEQDYLRVAPDFIAEIMSGHESVLRCKARMEEVWMANGVRLAWLIDPEKEKVYCYRKGGKLEIIKGFDCTVSGKDVLPNFRVDLRAFRLSAL